MTDQLTKDMYLIIEGKFYYVLDRAMKTQGRQGGLIILKLKDLDTMNLSSMTIKSGTKLEQIIPETKQFQYLYTEGDRCYFMDSESYETIDISEKIIGDYKQYLKEGDKILVVVYEGRILSIRKNPTVELIVTESVDAVRGDTSGNAMKVVTLETGATVNVPLFINTGDKIVINTETGTYNGRVNS